MEMEKQKFPKWMFAEPCRENRTQKGILTESASCCLPHLVYILGAPKSLLPWNKKMLVSWKKSYDQPRQHIKKQRHYFTKKSPSSQSYGFSSSHIWMWVLDCKIKLSTEELMLLNRGVGEDSWESLGLQGNPTSPFKRKLVLNIHWKDWCWNWSSNTLATWCEELTHLKIS